MDPLHADLQCPACQTAMARARARGMVPARGWAGTSAGHALVTTRTGNLPACTYWEYLLRVTTVGPDAPLVTPPPTPLEAPSEPQPPDHLTDEALHAYREERREERAAEYPPGKITTAQKLLQEAWEQFRMSRPDVFQVIGITAFSDMKDWPPAQLQESYLKVRRAAHQRQPPASSGA